MPAGTIQIYIRRHMEEPAAFKEMKAAQAAGTVRQATLGEMLRNHMRDTFLVQMARPARRWHPRTT